MEPKGTKKGEIIIPQVEMFMDHVLLTAHKHTITASGVLLQDNKGNILTRQTVVAAGPNAAVTVGEEVEIDPGRFKFTTSPAKHGVGPDIKHIQVPIEIINDVAYLFMSTRELKYKYKSATGEQELPEPNIQKTEKE